MRRGPAGRRRCGPPKRVSGPRGLIAVRPEGDLFFLDDREKRPRLLRRRMDGGLDRARARSDSKNSALFPVRSRLLDEEDSLLVGGDDVEQAVAVEVDDDELGADTALVVDP